MLVGKGLPAVARGTWGGAVSGSIRLASSSAAPQTHAPTKFPGLKVARGDIRDGLTFAVGNTPLIRLDITRQVAERALGRPIATLLGKAEWMNPGGSVKDRAALGLIVAAEESGALKPGGVVVEGACDC